MGAFSTNGHRCEQRDQRISDHRTSAVRRQLIDSKIADDEVTAVLHDADSTPDLVHYVPAGLDEYIPTIWDDHDDDPFGETMQSTRGNLREARSYLVAGFRVV